DEPQKEKLTAIVQQADHLAAQFDRDKRPADDPKGNPAYDRMEAITERIAIPSENLNRRNSAERARYYYKLAPLSLSGVIFPKEGSKDERNRENLKEEYGRLWQGFIQEHKLLPHDNVRIYFDSLLYLLHKYTWAIPSATYVDYPTISLYDHSRVTAALAICLY